MNNLNEFLSKTENYEYRISGIYLLINDEDMEIYIGESFDIAGRLDKHQKSNKEQRKWTGSWIEKKVRVRIYKMPDSSKKERLELEKDICEMVITQWTDYKLINKGY